MDPNLTSFPFSRLDPTSVHHHFVCLLDPIDTTRVIGLVGRVSVLAYLVVLGGADPTRQLARIEG